MSARRLGIVVSGATGRMGRRQHLGNALLPIRREGGLPLAHGARLLPDLLLVGRDEGRLEAVAAEAEIVRWTSDLDAALSDPAYELFFDAAATEGRGRRLAAAVEAGKHVYAEKPVVNSSTEGLAVLEAAERRGLKHGAVQDKLHLPGMRKLRKLVDAGFFGRLVSFKLDFGYWVFDGTTVPCQRSSWNYQAARGGGMIFDMFPHWRYLIEGILGPIAALVAMAWTAVPLRVDEAGRRYEVDVEDTVQCLVRFESGAHGMICSSWADRPRRDDVLTLRIDGTAGVAIAGGHRCFTQATAETPRASWDPDRDLAVDYPAQWSAVPDAPDHLNPYRRGWEGFLRHLAEDTPFDATLRAGVRDVLFAEAVRTSVASGTWVTFEGPR